MTYMAAAFPSACGKTNLAMMVSALEKQGYRVWTIGDDIAWMHVGADGTLRAINPEAGFFGVAPGTNEQTNPNIMGALHKNTIFTNVGLTASREPWWEGIGGTAPQNMTTWKGEPTQRGFGACRASELTLYRASQSVALDFVPLGRSRGRADLRDHFWRQAREARAAGL